MKQPGILYAFFDFEVAPCTFNIMEFLVLAEIERLKKGCRSIHVVIVPGPDEGFRENQLDLYRELGAIHYQSDVMRWRLFNIVVPCCQLLPSCQKVTVCTSREEAVELESALVTHVFPKGYLVRSPTDCSDLVHIMAAASREIFLPSLKATPQALSVVRSWLQTRQIDETKLVTITLRESPYENPKNSSLKDWGEFGRSLDASVHFPVIIRDTDAVFGPVPPELEGLTIFSDVSWNIELRAALYELAYLNMFLTHGPVWFCCHNRQTRYIMVMKNNTCGAGLWSHLHSQGLTPGSQLSWGTPFQQLVWNDDEFEVLKSSYNGMCETIDRFTSARIEDLIQTYEACITKNDLNTAEWIAGIAVEQFPENPKAWYIRSKILQKTNQFDEALSAVKKFVLLQKQLDPSCQKTSLNEFIEDLDKVGVN